MKRTPEDQPQTSEVHETTEDASRSPARPENLPPHANSRSDPTTFSGADKSFEEREKTFPEDVRVRRDESDVGGPIQVEVDEQQIRKTPDVDEPKRIDDDEVME